MVKPKQASPNESFEQAVAELEAIVAIMERDDQPLDQALANYQRGVTLLRQCQGTLLAAEQKIRMLEDGQLVDLQAEHNQ